MHHQTNRPDTEPLMTPGEVAAYYRVSPKTVTRWAREGVLKAARRTPGGHSRFREADVIAIGRPVVAPENGAPSKYPEPGRPIPGQPGYVVGTCGHRVAGSEWRVGFRTCERCPAAGAADDATDGES